MRRTTVKPSLADRETTQPVNFRAVSQSDWYAFWTKFEQALRDDQREGETCAAYHRRKLGPETRQWTGGMGQITYHVWEAELWRVYANGILGISFEVPIDDPKPWDAMKDYCVRLGIADRLDFGRCTI
jgi:hypothetical protein